MKNCIIVNFFVSTIEQEYLLTKSLESMSDLGYDIILSTNSPISKEIQSLCTHVIYNKKNRLLSVVDGLKNDFDLIPSTYFKSGDGTIEFKYINFFGRSYILGILDSMYSSYNFAKSLGYTNAHFFVGDIILSSNQGDSLRRIENEYRDWFGYFENNINKIGYYGIECLYWYSNIEWFIDLFLKQTQESGFLETLKDCFYLESYFAKIIYSNPNIFVNNFDGKSKLDCLQTELNENLSTTSISDGFTLRWDNNKNTIGLFVINTSENNRKFEVLFTDEFGNTQLFTNIVLPNYFWVDECNLNLNNRLRLKVICDGVLMIDFDFDKISLDRYKKLYEIYTIN